MTRVALWCSQRDWFVFDSITHPGTVLYDLARENDVPALRRDLFLDHHQDADSIRARLDDAVRMSERYDRIVYVIAHPRSTTWAVLREEIPLRLEQGVEFERLSQGLTRVSSSSLAEGDNE